MKEWILSPLEKTCLRWISRGRTVAEIASLEDARRDSLYVSTGGGWAPATDTAIRLLAAREDVLLVAATDNNAQGDVYAERLKAITGEIGCDFERLRPDLEDWNEDLPAQLRANSRREPVS